MPKRTERGDNTAPTGPGEPIQAKELIGDEEFLSSLRSEVERLRRETTEKVDENKQLKIDTTRRLLQDLWEVHNMFDEVGIHMTIDPPHTSFALFDSFPDKWSFKQGYDFSALNSMELKDRTPGWVGDSLRMWYYTTQEGKTHLRMIFEWCEGETYQKYSGWMRIITQVVLYDAPAAEANMAHLHGIVKDVVLAWHAGHINRDREKFLTHLREKYPKGSTQAKSY
ncbi:MAG: hypothetical protein M1144_07065 [Candidatus Thermoplasmatota archaeon]|jgi:hypothetical protein|nr:hypothetical protein [Candidatus Thermoplasmatota archaeon]